MSADNSDEKESPAGPALKQLVCGMCHQPFEWPKKRTYCLGCAELRKRESMREANRRSYYKYVNQGLCCCPGERSSSRGKS